MASHRSTPESEVALNSTTDFLSTRQLKLSPVVLLIQLAQIKKGLTLDSPSQNKYETKDLSFQSKKIACKVKL